MSYYVPLSKPVMAKLSYYIPLSEANLVVVLCSLVGARHHGTLHVSGGSIGWWSLDSNTKGVIHVDHVMAGEWP